MAHTVLTIGRQFGSGGRIVAQRALGCALFVGGLWLLFSWGLGVLIPLGEIWP